MSLSRAIGSAYSGLASNSFRADIAATNIANATTPGYVRREAIVSENVSGGRGSGVRIAGVVRHQDIGLSTARREADSAYGRANIIATAYNQINAEFGSPGEDYGFFSSFEAFEAGLRELATTPETLALQNAALEAAKSLVNDFNSLAGMTNDLRVETDRNIAQSVSTINQSLNRLEELNGLLGGINQQSGDTVALEDERQRLLDTVSEYIPIKVLQQDDGSLDIMTEDGVFLLAGTAKELSFEQATIIPAGTTYNDGSGILSGLFVGDQELTPGTSGNFALKSGVLAGQFTVRDSVSTGFSAQLDSLAADLITRFSDDALDPTKAAGAPGLFTDAGGPVDPANIPGIAGRLRINAAVDPAQGGIVTRLRDGIGAATVGPSGEDGLLNGYVDALTNAAAAPAETGLVGNYSVVELVAGVSSIVGESRIRHDAVTASTLARSNFLFEAELSSSGVDTDQEMQSILLIEQAYAANARVIQTVGEMFDRLLQI